MSAAIDRWVWYAGWSDKFTQVLGGLNPVAGPFFDISAPEATGVVAVVAPQASSLLGLVSVVAPVIVSGNTAVVLTSEERPLPAITLAECLATSDVPGAWSTSSPVGPPRWHRGWRAIVTSMPSTSRGPPEPTASTGAALELAAADNLKRVRRPGGTGTEAVEPDFTATPDLSRLTAFLRPRPSGTPRAAEPPTARMELTDRVRADRLLPRQHGHCGTTRHP